jgi:hypothetical protein
MNRQECEDAQRDLEGLEHALEQLPDEPSLWPTRQKAARASRALGNVEFAVAMLDGFAAVGSSASTAREMLEALGVWSDDPHAVITADVVIEATARYRERDVDA